VARSKRTIVWTVLGCAVTVTSIGEGDAWAGADAPTKVRSQLSAIRSKQPMVGESSGPSLLTMPVSESESHVTISYANGGDGYAFCATVRNSGSSPIASGGYVHFEAYVGALVPWSNSAAQDVAIGSVAPHEARKVCTTANLPGYPASSTPLKKLPTFIAWIYGAPNNGKGVSLWPAHHGSLHGKPSTPVPTLRIEKVEAREPVSPDLRVAVVVRNAGAGPATGAKLVATGKKGASTYATKSVTVDVPKGATKTVELSIPPPGGNLFSDFRDVTVSGWNIRVEASIMGVPNDGAYGVVDRVAWRMSPASF